MQGKEGPLFDLRWCRARRPTPDKAPLSASRDRPCYLSAQVVICFFRFIVLLNDAHGARMSQRMDRQDPCRAVERGSAINGS
ncbi:hypothetical protein GOP47_0025904 [Adiantum capillus-veneris]|uniref:Uncharacterized protein n=1 Tax=Adiantum capillus-veneris TaxID=13818 RepID=A0A9D4U1C3_ADICA|nr:hypothetical protein GOP47_0025904 [Adiantum capillus-veneris]